MTEPGTVGPAGISDRSSGGGRCVPLTGPAAERLVPVLHDAEEDDDRIRSALRDPACGNYAALIGDLLVGAAVVHWGTGGESSELLYLAVDRDQRGKGYGTQIVAAVR